MARAGAIIMQDKITRDAELIAFKLKNPCLTLEQIGHKYNISRQRVDQILFSVDIHVGKRRKPRPLCLNCGKPCKEVRAVYCSEKCHSEQHRVTVFCTTCGKPISKTISQIIRGCNDSRYRGNFFCDKHCSGADAGKKYGFGSHRKNIGEGHRFKRKYEYGTLIEEYKSSGITKTAFAKSKGIPASTVYGILSRVDKC